MEEEKKGTLKTADGCKRLIAIFVAVILLASFSAQLISSDFGKVKISNLSIDVRGGTLNFDLYYPSGTTADSNLPAVIVNHGGGVVKGVMKGIAEEIAHRGFVVMNVSSYNVGLSDNAVVQDAAGGLVDSADYLRSLTYVDPTRISIVGHSAGSRRAGNAAIADCGAFTLNDLLVNELYNTFGIELTEEEINENADELAEKYLAPEQMDYYYAIKADQTEYYNTRIKSIVLLGSNANLVSVLQTVEVAGHEVTRNYQVNIGIVNGLYDISYYNYPTLDYSINSWHTSGEEIAKDTWYVIDDVNSSSKTVGAFGETSVTSNTELAQAFEDRATRVYTDNPETHSKNFFSSRTASDVVRILEQVNSYNRGELTAASTTPLDASVSTWAWRAVLNCIAMLAMIGMIAPVASLLTKSKFFAPCVAEEAETKPVNKRVYWIGNIIIVILSFIAIFMGNNLWGPSPMGPAPAVNIFNSNSWMFPIMFTAGFTMRFLVYLTIFLLIWLVVFTLIEKKKGENSLKRLNLGIKFSAIVKCLLMAFVIIFVSYLMLSIVLYLFNQDFRLWEMSFTAMKGENWFVSLRMALVYFLPVFLVSGSVVNFTIRKDLPDWLDTLITVVVGSLGIWLLALINILIAKVAYDGTLFSRFICTYSVILFVPVTVYVGRKLYKVTHSVWLGAFVNALLLGWSIVAATGFSNYGPSLLSNFLGM